MLLKMSLIYSRLTRINFQSQSPGIFEFANLARSRKFHKQKNAIIPLSVGDLVNDDELIWLKRSTFAAAKSDFHLVKTPREFYLKKFPPKDFCFSLLLPYFLSLSLSLFPAFPVLFPPPLLRRKRSRTKGLEFLHAEK